MHLGQAQALGLDGYLQRIKPYIPMLQAKYPHVPIVAHSTPVGRVGERAQASFHEWNQALARLPGIDGFSQYGWPEFGTDVRRLMAGTSQETPDTRWRQYDEFARTFPDRQLTAYQQDWGGDKKMYMLQWGTHLDRNTPVQGLHMANFYFFLAQYNAAHNDYFAVATSAPILAENASTGARRGGVIYKDKIALMASYLYTKPFRHLFSGDKKLLAATVQAAGNDSETVSVKAVAALGPDGRKYVYLLNSGPALSLGKVAVDGKLLPTDLRVEIESVWGDPASNSGDAAGRGASAPARTFTGERSLNAVVLEPFSLTLLITPSGAQQKAAPSAKDAASPAFAPVKDDPALPRVLLIGDSISIGYTVPVQRALAGKANVHRPAANCGTTTKGLENLDEWLGDGHWDVIHFNWGLHDLQQTPLDQYDKNLRALVTRLKKTGAVLVWCSTTPVPVMGPGRKSNEDLKAYNAAAKRIMDENGVQTDDLFAFALPHIKDLQIPANVHFTGHGYGILAEQVSASILATLKRRPAHGMSSAPGPKERATIARPATTQP
jgi:acyl-CoA thioesterase-1